MKRRDQARDPGGRIRRLGRRFLRQPKAGFEVTGKINRKEFGLTWGGVTEAGAIVLGDDVKLIANVQFAKQA